MQVQVLGTHFNVNAYDEVTRVTLLEGRVKVGNRQSAIGNEKPVILKPGEQAEVKPIHRSPFTIHQI